MMEENSTPDGVLLTWEGGTQATQIYREEFIKLLRQWREQGDVYEKRQEQRETFEILRKALPHKFPSERIYT